MGLVPGIVDHLLGRYECGYQPSVAYFLVECVALGRNRVSSRVVRPTALWPYSPEKALP